MLLTRICDYFRGMVQSVYDWMLRMAESPYAMYFLAMVAFIESSFFPIPPDIMLIPMVLAMPDKAWKIASIATVASVLGGCFGYGIGVFGYELIAKPILEFYGYMHQFDVFQSYYHEWGAWIVFGAGITPFPYKVITIASGVVDLNLWVFSLASVLAVISAPSATSITISKPALIKPEASLLMLTGVCPAIAGAIMATTFLSDLMARKMSII